MLKKDLLELCLLELLTQGEQYGYELLQRMYTEFPDTQESMIYALLRGLCRDGYTEQYRVDASGGPPRKYYLLTNAGRRRHADLLAAWRNLKRAMTALGIE